MSEATISIMRQRPVNNGHHPRHPRDEIAFTVEQARNPPLHLFIEPCFLVGIRNHAANQNRVLTNA